MNSVIANPVRVLLAVAMLAAGTLPAAGQIVLPEGNGKALVQSTCAKCHGFEKLTVGMSRDDWKETLELMVRYGTPLKPSDVTVLSDYLASAFPGGPRPRGVVVPGPIDATITEWKLTSAGARPHDPAVAPDGSVWYTGQANSTLGRLDPRTGAFREYPLKPATDTGRRLPYGVGPHGLVADKAGHIWFTGQLAGYVGKLDPKSGAVVEYHMPDAKARDPHTPIFDQKGTLWFTLQNSNMVGRIVPATGATTVVSVPTPASQPYGIVVNSKGVPFFSQLTGTRLGSIDPATMAIREYPLPPGTMARRIAVTADDMLWYTDYARGYLGRLDPTNGSVKEWPTPSGAGPGAQPYAITAVGNVVWYVEGGTNPNIVVRFDPATATFQSWAIPSGGGVVRHMVAAPDGSLWLACSAVDTLAKVEVKPPPATR